MLATFGRVAFFEGVDLGEAIDEVGDVGVAEQGHAGVEVVALAAAAEHDFGEPFFCEFGADVGQWWRDAALVAEGFGGAGEVGVAVGRDAAEPVAVVAGDAVEGGEGFVDVLEVVEGGAVGFWECGGDEFLLIGGEVEVWGSGFVGEAAVGGVEVCDRGEVSFGDAEVVVALGAAEVLEVGFAGGGQGGVGF